MYALLVILAIVLTPAFCWAQQGMPRPVLSAAPAPSVSPNSPSPAGAVAPRSGSAQSAPEGTNSTRYIIGPDDNLQVTVWKEPALSGTLPVRPDGMISLALVGDLPASGFTPMQLSADISERLKKFVNDPNVTVTVLGVHLKQVYLMGEVQHVGPVALMADMSPLQAIATAGGLSPFANAKRIYILRTEQGKQKKIPFDYKKAIKDGNQQGISLLPGDTIVVP